MVKKTALHRENTRQIALLAMFASIIVLLAYTPIGFIQLGFIKATIIHVPVIIGSIMLGPKMGAALGGVFGLTSMVSNTMAPVISSFAFSPLIPVPGIGRGSLLALLVCFIPRILVGVFPWFVYHLLQKLFKKSRSIPALAIAGIIGSMTNTLLVMHLIYFLFQDAYATVRDVPAEAVYGVILTIIATNGIPEAIVAAVLSTSVCKALLSIRSNKGASNTPT